MAPLALGIAGLSLLVAACAGGAPSSSVARIGKTTSSAVVNAGASVTAPINPAIAAQQYKRALKFSQCMRAHGISDFPDPGSGGGIQITNNGPRSDLNPGDPTFVSAQDSCQKYSPVRQPSPQQQAAAQAGALAFAACMRKNGVPGYPDPQFLSGGRVFQKISSGVSPNSPTFQAAAAKVQWQRQNRRGWCAHPGPVSDAAPTLAKESYPPARENNRSTW